MRIILVDDNKDFRTNIQFFLEKRLNHTVIASFQDGLSFFDQVTKLSPDIILMDISMPDLDGYAITKKLKTAKRQTHIKKKVESENDEKQKNFSRSRNRINYIK